MIYFPVHSTVNVAAIVGGVVGGVVGVCLCCCAVCLCITVCCCCRKKRSRRRTTTTATTATPRTTVQPATVDIINQKPAQGGQQDCSYIIPPEVNPGYDPTMQAGYESYPATYTQPSPYPPVPGGTLPLTNPPAEDTLPPAYPAVDDKTLPPAYPAPGGTLPAGYPPQQVYPTQPPDLPPPYPVAASPFYAPQ